jgi:hypothetical protein
MACYHNHGAGIPLETATVDDASDDRVVVTVAHLTEQLRTGRFAPPTAHITDLVECGAFYQNVRVEPIVEVAAVFTALRKLTLALPRRQPMRLGLAISKPSLVAAAIHTLSELTELTLQG